MVIRVAARRLLPLSASVVPRAPSSSLSAPYRRLTALARTLSMAPSMPSSAPFKYPAVRRDESVVETLHGVAVADPYRWLEDQTSEETAAFVTEQNKLFEAYMQDSTLRGKVRRHEARLRGPALTRDDRPIAPVPCPP